MKEIILLKQGELVLKGLNRRTFEEKLLKNIRYSLFPIGKFKIYTAQSTVYIEPLSDDIDMKKTAEKLKKVFGIASLCRSCVCDKNITDMEEKAVEYLKEDLLKAKTFRVEARRSDKKFPLTSPQIAAQIGGKVLECFPHLKVTMDNPEIVIKAEVRDYSAFISGSVQKGAGGMPVGSNGRAALLLSGGIDSPVAGYMIAKRGVCIDAIHFHSYPYTSERAREKVISLAKIMTAYTGRIRLYIVPFTKIQEQLRDTCNNELFTILMRRIMMKISEKIAVSSGALALITGESIGQVASQTMEALYTTDNAVNLPVFRPVIGMDKDEIVKIARDIDTFETSILPYEDCCTIFAPKHPKTKPRLPEVLEEEAKLNIDALVEETVENVEKLLI